ncbi:MAG: DNA repair protein RadC [Pseudoflavonifractor sp.]|nr:DNA repair protein RadC [Pseudoflavonifractor sp.]
MYTPEYRRRICDLDAADKPREKAMEHGVNSLTNAELIAIVLGSGLPGKSVIDLAREILADNGNRVGALASLSVNDLVKRYKGIGPAKAVTLLSAIHLSRRIALDSKRTDPVITGSDSIYELMCVDMENLPHEEFWIVLLSRANRVIKRRRISVGGTASTVVDVKIIMKEALDSLAAAIAVVHNHPSGNLRPSTDDDRLTMKIRDAAALLDIKLLDHLIIGQGGYYSYHDEGRI